MVQRNLCAGVFWKEVGNIMLLDGQSRFGLFCKLMSGLVSIPCSNADSERARVCNVKEDSH